MEQLVIFLALGAVLLALGAIATLALRPLSRRLIRADRQTRAKVLFATGVIELLAAALSASEVGLDRALMASVGVALLLLAASVRWGQHSREQSRR